MINEKISIVKMFSLDKNNSMLSELERQALDLGLLLRLQIRRPLGLWALRLVVAIQASPEKVQIVGEMKGWAYPAINGLQLDTMRVSRQSPNGVGDLIWSAAMSWALEETPCKRVRILAIDDEDKKHLSLVRYFNRRGFESVRNLGSSPFDLPLRTIWGGAGVLMVADCNKVRDLSLGMWKKFAL